MGKDGEVMFETYNFPDGKNDDRWYHWCAELRTGTPYVRNRGQICTILIYEYRMESSEGVIAKFVADYI